MIAVEFEIVFVVSTTIAFCIGALFAWCCREFHIVVSMRVELLRQNIWCFNISVESVSV